MGHRIKFSSPLGFLVPQESLQTKSHPGPLKALRFTPSAMGNLYHWIEPLKKSAACLFGSSQMGCLLCTSIFFYTLGKTGGRCFTCSLKIRRVLQKGLLSPIQDRISSGFQDGTDVGKKLRIIRYARLLFHYSGRGSQRRLCGCLPCPSFFQNFQEENLAYSTRQEQHSWLRFCSVLLFHSSFTGQGTEIGIGERILLNTNPLYHRSCISSQASWI